MSVLVKRIFVAMAAGMLAVAEIFGFDAPERAELGAEKDVEPVEEMIEPVGATRLPRGEVVSLEQPHVHLESAEEITFALPSAVGGSPAEAPRYTLTLRPVLMREDEPNLLQTAVFIRLAYIEKIGDPVIWQPWGSGNNWKSAPGGIQMVGRESDPEQLTKDLSEKLQLPSQQVGRLMAILLAGHAIMVGNEPAEPLAKQFDAEKLRKDLEELHGLSSAHADRVMAAVAGETSSLGIPPSFGATASQLMAAKIPIGAGSFMKLWAQSSELEPVYSSVPLIKEPLNSLRVFRGPELESFGMRLPSVITTLMPRHSPGA